MAGRDDRLDWPRDEPFERNGHVTYEVRCPFCGGHQCDVIVIPGLPGSAILSTCCRFKRCKEGIWMPLGGLLLP